MSCKTFKKFEIGKISEREFQQHLKTCAFCLEQVKQDTRLLSLAKSLKKPIEAPSLWNRIEENLRNEQNTGIRSEGKQSRWGLLRLLPAAAAALLIMSVGFYFLLRPETGKSGILTESRLAKVEKKEREYVEAIEELEERILPKMADMNLELMLLYRDRLETIDEQIVRCREALSENPGNAHIRRYMLAALQDKTNTLKELLESEPINGININL
jgi:hypothetical protein